MYRKSFLEGVAILFSRNWTQEGGREEQHIGMAMKAPFYRDLDKRSVAESDLLQVFA